MEWESSCQPLCVRKAFRAKDNGPVGADSISVSDAVPDGTSPPRPNVSGAEVGGHHAPPPPKSHFFSLILLPRGLSVRLQVRRRGRNFPFMSDVRSLLPTHLPNSAPSCRVAFAFCPPTSPPEL
ncbi:hypothetical protein MRX96_011644 [Rhipicephalus microplus]